QQGRFDEAESLLRERVAFRMLLGGLDGRWTLDAQADLARLYRQWGKPALAVPILAEGVGRARKKPEEHYFVSHLKALIETYEELGRHDDADRLHDELLAHWKQQADTDPSSYATSLAWYGLELIDRRRWAAAESVLRECLAIREVDEPDEWTTFNAKSLL